MSTEELVSKLVDYVNAGQNVKAEEELYAQNVISHEQDGLVVTGLANVIEKTKKSMEMFEEFYGGGVETAYVGKDNFLLHFKMDVKPKGGERMEFAEYGFYKVAEGKVSEEYFFAQPSK